MNLVFANLPDKSWACAYEIALCYHKSYVVLLETMLGAMCCQNVLFRNSCFIFGMWWEGWSESPHRASGAKTLSYHNFFWHIKDWKLYWNCLKIQFFVMTWYILCWMLLHYTMHISSLSRTVAYNPWLVMLLIARIHSVSPIWWMLYV